MLKNNLKSNNNDDLRFLKLKSNSQVFKRKFWGVKSRFLKIQPLTKSVLEEHKGLKYRKNSRGLPINLVNFSLPTTPKNSSPAATQREQFFDYFKNKLKIPTYLNISDSYQKKKRAHKNFLTNTRKNQNCFQVSESYSGSNSNVEQSYPMRIRSSSVLMPKIWKKSSFNDTKIGIYNIDSTAKGRTIDTRDLIFSNTSQLEKPIIFNQLKENKKPYLNHLFISSPSTKNHQIWPSLGNKLSKRSIFQNEFLSMQEVSTPKPKRDCSKLTYTIPKKSKIYFKPINLSLYDMRVHEWK